MRFGPARGAAPSAFAVWDVFAPSAAFAITLGSSKAWLGRQLIVETIPESEFKGPLQSPWSGNGLHVGDGVPKTDAFRNRGSA